MTPEEFEAFKQAWLDYPSQDNEGYVPDRGGFKCGWFAALEWVKSQGTIIIEPGSDVEEIINNRKKVDDFMVERHNKREKK